MAKKKQADKEPESRWRWMIWLVAAGAWLLFAAALFSHDPADPPSHYVTPHNAKAHNWVGQFGAGLSYKLLHMFGPGIWVAMAGWFMLLAASVKGRIIDQLGLRITGVVIMGVSASALTAMWWTGDTAAPEGAGGLLGLYLVDQIQPRFGFIGGSIVFSVTFWVGGLLAADQLLLTSLRWLGEKAGVLASAAHAARPALAGGVASVANLRTLFRRGGDGDGTMLRPKAKVGRRGRDKNADDDDAISTEAGGLGGYRSFDPDNPDAEVEDAAEGDEEEWEWEYVDEDAEAAAEGEEDGQVEDEYEEEEPEHEEEAAESEQAHDAADAYTKGKKEFTPDELRAKIKQLPINFAPHKAQKAQAPVREADFSGYQFPGIDILEEPETDFSEEMEQIVRDQAVSLESALQEYKIEGEVVGIDSGPVITLFEVRLAPGTKVSRINSVSNDLARALKAQNIRVVPNMVGKDTIGIEVPNIKKEKVRLKELMSANPDILQKMKLPMYLGKDASGNPLIQDLAAMPHMLIAGTTGSGKSVCMNSIIMSFLYTKRPDELKLVLVDPKMVEMSMFKDIPHLMCPVVTEMAKAASILEWAVTKMDERYELLAEVGVRDIAGYNGLGWEEIKERMQPATEDEEKRIPKKLPYMVFIIDELADLMMTNKEVENFIVRIAQKARAVGLHLILATQRPQANVVTGLIKGNMPCRVSFKVASRLDSRIVLDQAGAELLLGYGDMLFLSPRSSKLIRAQGTLVDDFEIRRVAKFLKNVSEPSFEPQLVQMKSAGIGEDDDGERDELFEDAVRVVLESQRGSVSLLQRRLTIGYSRASRLIEQIAETGLLGPYKGSQAREVTMTLEEYEAIKAQAEADAAAVEVNGNVDADEGEEGEYEDYEDDDGVPDEMDGEYRE